MSDYIEKQAAIDELVRWGKIPDYSDKEKILIGAVIGMLSSLPSVQPDIIRCKDCKYCDSYIAEITSDGNMERIEYRCKEFHASVMPDEYCSRGETR